MYFFLVSLERLCEQLKDLSYYRVAQCSPVAHYGGHSDRGGRRSPPPSGSRRKTAPRSKDRGGHSGFLAGPAGDRQKTAGRPSGKAPSTMKPARNGAGGVAGVRRVQWHPSRFSLSAKQTVKIFVGPC
ncbi:hypothetical protein NDU88_004919 [Pleurodeles waltl]|uniref:Uncharacterized protein n=1 Tax=Pleurodeles waltl TaxID=8319 RepID=A0AAV7QJL4_PLEWA|nr:hypothetical protein NDU88_004919 [Pleurodeles waltl]